MGRISDIIPGLYYGGNNDLIRFTDALDVEVSSLEKQVRGITDLINVDKCPDEKLPYLAALTNCPLIGDDPVFWRKQIKNWPYILKLKGTERSLELVLDSIGAQSWAIKTFFRDAGGGYVTDKPKGTPFQDNSGLWHNIRTHYFGVEFTLSKDFVERQNYRWNVDDVKKKLNFWFERGKPYHAELLSLLIFPPKILPDDHICEWDVCSWEHLELRKYFWGLLIPDNPFFDDVPLFGRNFERGIVTASDTQRWDFSTWGGSPYRLLQVGTFPITGIFASLEWGEGEAAMLYPNVWDNSKWDYVSTFTRLIGSYSTQALSAKIDVKPQISGLTSYTGILARVWPYWDKRTWKQHYTWRSDLPQEAIIPSFTRGITASLSWNASRERENIFWDKERWDYQRRKIYDAPRMKWTARKTWRNSKTWRTTTEQFATGQVKYKEAM